MLTVALLLAPYSGGVARVQASGTVTNYSFPALLSDPGNSNWTLLKTVPQDMRLTPTSFQMISNQVTGAVYGEEIEIRFRVPTTGYYDLNLISWKNSAGGKVDIWIDDESVSSSFSFYAPSATSPAPEEIASMKYLAAGDHILTFKAMEATQLPANARYYLYLYLSSLELVLQQEIPVLSKLTLSGNKMVMQVGEQSNLSLNAKMSDGSSLPLAQLEQVTYGSNQAAVMSVAGIEGGAVVTALSAGVAEITVTASKDGVEKQGKFVISVEDGRSVSYSFNELPNSTLPNPTNPNWYVQQTNPVDLRVTPTSIQLINNAATSVVNGEAITVGFYVPRSGYYDLALESFQNSAGGKVDIRIDGQPVSSSYSFYAPELQPSAIIGLANGLELHRGMHTISFTAQETVKLPANGRYYAYLYLNRLKLNLKEIIGPQELESMEARLAETDLFVGDVRRLYVTGLLNTGARVDSSVTEVTYSSSNPAVASVANGFVTVHQPGEAVIHVNMEYGSVTLSQSIPITASEVSSSKTRSTYYTEAKVNNARHNITTYTWAQGARDSAIALADKYVQLGYEALWNAVTAQSLPRSYGVNQQKGSPVTGLDINRFGNYPYTADPINNPWRITDPSSGYQFPTNDFGAYYRSGLNPNGEFDPKLADRSLLVNTLYPEKGPTWGVDDGFGWVDEKGDKYTFIAYYLHWNIWYGGFIRNAINSLKDAYLLTGDAKYAGAGIVLLDRIADVYPEMDTGKYKRADGYLNSDGNRDKGKVVGSIWETGLASDFLMAYDAYFPAMNHPGAIAFLSSKADQYDLGILKKSATGIKRNIEDGILREIYPAVKNISIYGNNGMHQRTLALAAVVLDTMPETKEWLDFNFQAGGLLWNPKPSGLSGGNIAATLVNDVDRNGFGNEASPEYNQLWLWAYHSVAEILDGYDKYPEADLFLNPKFEKMYSAQHPLILSKIYTATIGDAGMTGSPLSYLKDPALYLKAFQKFKTPIYAQLVYYLNGNRATGIRGDIFTENPEAIADEIEQVIEQHGRLSLDSDMLSGYGFGALRDGISYDVPGITYDFKQLDITVSTATYKVFENSGTLQFEADSPGHRIAFAFDVDKTDNYEVDLRPFRAGSYGIYSIRIDDIPIKTMDFSGSSGALATTEVIADLTLSQGRHEISFEAVGKNPVSTNYKLGVIQLQLLDSEAQALRDDPKRIDTLRDTWMYFGRNSGHGHRDTLNLGMHAFGLDLLPELGYPEFADNASPRMHEWENNTISHNTVVVDKSKMGIQTVGQPVHFDNTDTVKLIEVDAADSVYPQTDMYRRTTAMIRVDSLNSYAVDFFRVKGGNDHHFSFHSADAVVTTEGLDLVAQTSGTYAGANVPYGQRPANDSVAGPYYTGSGFHYLKNVAKDTAPANAFSVDWNVKDTWNIYQNGAGAPTDVHLRLTMLTETNNVALADGVPPTNKTGNPASLRYLIANRTGTNLQSNFASIIEPYKGQRFVSSIETALVEKDGLPILDEVEVKAIKVQLSNGRTDYIISSIETDKTYTIDGLISFRGAFGVLSEQNGEIIYAYVNDGGEIGYPGGDILQGPSSFEGTVVDFTHELVASNSITVDVDLQGESIETLLGRWIYIENDGTRNAAYPIVSATPLGGLRYELGIGDLTPIRSYVNASDFSQGFVYDIAPGAAFRIPLSHSASMNGGPTSNKLTVAGYDSPAKAGTNGQLHAKTVDAVDITAWSVFTSSDSSVAEVLPGGIIVYKKMGTTVIGATYGALASEPVTVNVVGASASVGKPGKPVLSHDNGHDTGLLDGAYTVTMNMWQGNNGTVYQLYENDMPIDTKLLVDSSPGAQTVSTAVYGKANGEYVYRAILTNGYGTVQSDPITVTVKHASPAKPILSHDNWDGDGTYSVIMNMWWGTNGTQYRLYENGILIDSRPLAAATPGAQTVVTSISDRSPGTYEYYVVLANGAGESFSGTIVVTVEPQ
jgi:hypothetical protein